MTAPATDSAAILDRLSAGIAQLTTTEAWTSWLRTQSRFTRYSFGNAVLVARQAPGATQVAGFRAWQGLGRQVRAGEKSIRILAPCTRRELDEQTGEKVQRLLGFRVASVFDIAQTDGEALPEQPARRLQGDEAGDGCEKLGAVAASIGFTVEVTSEAVLGSANGDCSPLQRRIRIREDLAPAQTLKTLAHELLTAPTAEPRRSGIRSALQLHSTTHGGQRCLAQRSPTDSSLGTSPG